MVAPSALRGSAVGDIESLIVPHSSAVVAVRGKEERECVHSVKDSTTVFKVLKQPARLTRRLLWFEE